MQLNRGSALRSLLAREVQPPLDWHEIDIGSMLSLRRKLFQVLPSSIIQLSKRFRFILHRREQVPRFPECDPASLVRGHGFQGSSERSYARAFESECIRRIKGWRTQQGFELVEQRHAVTSPYQDDFDQSCGRQMKAAAPPHPVAHRKHNSFAINAAGINQQIIGAS
jgi:hypothetical protein